MVSELSSVCTCKLAPKAPAPDKLVPKPLWRVIEPAELTKSGMFTQNVPWLSASLMGTPFTVTLVLVASLPRTLMPVYPIPFPASDVVITLGNCCNKIGISLPELPRDNSFLPITLLLVVDCWIWFDFTITSSIGWKFIVWSESILVLIFDESFCANANCTVAKIANNKMIFLLNMLFRLFLFHPRHIK